MNEFEIIEHHFKRHAIARDDVWLGIGDDAALLCVPAGAYPIGVQATLSPTGVPPPDALAAGLFDRALARLTAKAVEPRWSTLAITLPREDACWLSAFATRLAARLAAHQVALVGGDTTRGPLTATLGLHGHVERLPLPTRAAAGDCLLLADAAIPETAGALRVLASRFAALPCDGDVATAAGRLAGERLCVLWEPAAPGAVEAGAVLLALPQGRAMKVPGGRRLGTLQPLADA